MNLTLLIFQLEIAELRGELVAARRTVADLEAEAEASRKKTLSPPDKRASVLVRKETYQSKNPIIF